VTAIVDDAYRAINVGKVLCIVSLDLKKAFPSVARVLLLEKLKKACIETQWFSEYLSHRTQLVKGPSGEFSKICNDVWGVPQGSVMGPILFSIFINELPTIPTWCKSLLFADDTNLRIVCYPSAIDTALKKVESDIRQITEYLNSNMLQLNNAKTELIVIGSAYNVRKIGVVSINVNGCFIDLKESITILGMTIDNTLSFKTHIIKMTRNCYAQMAPLFTLRPLVSDKNMIVLIKSLVFSHLYYMSIIWGGANKTNLQLVEKVIRNAARLLTRKGDGIPLQKLFRN